MLKPVWYGVKTFHVLEDFERHAITHFKGSQFTCDNIAYPDYEKYLGEEVVVAKRAVTESAKDVKKEEPTPEVKSKSVERREKIQKEEPKKVKKSIFKKSKK